MRGDAIASGLAFNRFHQSGTTPNAKITCLVIDGSARNSGNIRPRWEDSRKNAIPIDAILRVGDNFFIPFL